MKCSDLKRSVILCGAIAYCLSNNQSVRADYIIGKSKNLGSTVNTARDEAATCTSANCLELHFGSNRDGSLSNNYDLWVSTRPSINDPWGPAVNLGATVNSQYADRYPSLTLDGLTLYFSDSFMDWLPRPGGIGLSDIWMTTRTTLNDPWTTPVNLGPVINSPRFDCRPSISGDNLILVFSSVRSDGGAKGGYDLWMSTRLNAEDPWGAPVNLGANVNSNSHDLEGSISADGLALIYCSEGGVSDFDIFMTTRKSLNDPWKPAVLLEKTINTMSAEGSPSFSADMKTIYFDSNHQDGFGGYDIYQASISPVVDFTGDYIVDIDDLVILIEHWGQNKPSLDMGPAPWGDGIIDTSDLEVLMSYWGENFDPNCLAHWRLDESQGSVAEDSALSGADGKKQNATLVGNPIWQPQGGWAKGAIEFDGVDDYLSTDFVIDPFQGPMSIFAWIKGGAPGQAIISQGMAVPMFGSTWLGIDPIDGRLLTAHMFPLVPPLESDVVITDGQWHRVGLVWDGTLRHLYVDGDEVAKDLDPAKHMSSNLGLHIGADSHLTPGTFFSGLIDDVRIYDRAVEP